MQNLKKVKIGLISIVAIIICLFIGYKGYKYFKLKTIINTPVKELTLEEKLEDFEFLYNSIIEDYPFLEVNKRVNGVDFEANKDKYIEIIKTEPDFAKALSLVFADLNNSHTMLLNSEGIRFRIEVFENIRNNLGLWNEKMGSFFLDTLTNPLVLKRYNLPMDIANNKETGKQNEKQENKLQVNNAEAYDIVDGKVAYIYVPQMLNDYLRAKDEELISEYLQNIKDYQALIIDIRGNGGGSTNYWQNFLLSKIIKEDLKTTNYMFFKGSDFIQNYLDSRYMKLEKVKNLDTTSLTNLPSDALTDFEYYYKYDIEIKPSEDSIKFQGNIYLLVDDRVYSSAEGLANFAKQTGFATLIGSRTKGDGIGIDPPVKMLPNSNYVYSFSPCLGTTSNGTVNEEHKTMPDYVVNTANFPKEYINLDECINKVLELENIKNNN